MTAAPAAFARAPGASPPPAARHDAAGYARARDAAPHIRDRLLLIERRYHDDDSTCRGFTRGAISESCLDHSKAPAQAAVCTGGGRLVRQKRFAERTVG